MSTISIKMLCKKHIKNPSRTRVRTSIKDYGTSNRQRLKKSFKMRIELWQFLKERKQDFYAVDRGFCRC